MKLKLKFGAIRGVVRGMVISLMVIGFMLLMMYSLFDVKVDIISVNFAL